MSLFPRQPLGFEFEEDARLAISKIRDRTMVAYPALLSLWQAVHHCETQKLPGAFVECGVWKGGVGGLMALGNLAYGRARRPIYLYDAYDDICEPDPEKDGERALKEVESFANRDRSTISGAIAPLTGVYDHLGGPGNEGEVFRLLTETLRYPASTTHICKGWFQDTVPKAEVEQIAILRLDGDWYESTKVCLDNLYHRVVSGGFVIIDDYGTYEGCKLAVDEFLDALPAKPFLNFTNKDVRYWIKP